VITINGIAGGMSFSPSSASAAVGQQIEWHNAGTFTHRIAGNGGQFDTGNLASGATSGPITLSAGTIPYFCTIHPSTTGTLMVN